MTIYTREDKASWPDGMKICYGCRKMLPYEMFGSDKNKWLGLADRCKPCRKEYSRYHYNKWFRNNAEARLFSAARGRAKRQGIPFTITIEDIIIPDKCPVLGIPLYRENGKFKYNTPSIDRFVPSMGYVPGNICVISWRANWLKNDGTVEELELVAQWMRQVSDTID